MDRAQLRHATSQSGINMKLFYAASTNGFYSVDINGDGIPADAVEISVDEWTQLLDGQSAGQIITHDDNGNPILIDMPAPTHEQYVEMAEQQKQALIDTAMASISVIQLKLQAGRKLTDDEKTRLNAVLDYIDAVTAVDADAAPDINWPVVPEV